MNQPMNMASFLGALIGGFMGLVLGAYGWLAFYYIVFMRPTGTPFRVIDQGAIPTAIFGPLGGIVGATIGGLYFRRFGKSKNLKP